MSKIEWTGKTWNPLVGCSIVSPGCTNCYAMRQASRLLDKPGSHYEGTTKRVNGRAVWTGKVALAPEHILTVPLRTQKPTTWFVNSMSDLFHESVPDGWIAYVWSVMIQCPQHTFQILTKRSDRMRAWVAKWNDLSGDDNPMEFKNARGPEAVRRAHTSGRAHLFADYLDVMLQLAGGMVPAGAAWPTFDWMQGWKYWPHVPRNIWLGVSAEDQRRADERIPDLLATPAAVRFVSAEPLLGPIDFKGWCTAAWEGDRRRQVPAARLNWVIVGGESGPGARPMVLGWAKDVVRQCQGAGVPVFVKQVGAVPTNREGERCPHIRDRKGADPAEWPEVLRVREMPTTEGVGAWR